MPESTPKFTPEDFLHTTQLMVDLWNKPLNELSFSEFAKPYSPNVEWFDHAFFMHRYGHEGVASVRNAWLTCNQPFHVTVERILPTATGTIMQGFARGVFANDLREIKATGKEFTYQLCIVFEFDTDTGLIDKIDEYYTKNWHDSVSTNDYKIVGTPN